MRIATAVGDLAGLTIRLRLDGHRILAAGLNRGGEAEYTIGRQLQIVRTIVLQHHTLAALQTAEAAAHLMGDGYGTATVSPAAITATAGSQSRNRHNGKAALKPGHSTHKSSPAILNSHPDPELPAIALSEAFSLAFTPPW